MSVVLISNRKSHTGFSIGTDIGNLECSWTPSFYLRYFTEFDSFGGRLRHSGWRPIRLI